MGLMIDQVIGTYKITAKLGEGGMGLVYAGEHTLLGKRAAIKVLLPEYSKDPAVIERFFNEAKATTRVRHPGLVDIYDFGYHSDGSAFIVMELLEGESLATRLRRQRRLREPVIVEIVKQVASAVAAAHEANIVHRDLKPDNVFLVPDVVVSAGFRAKVLDFGIAKLIGADNLQKTRTGAVLGTPMYMSPEQCRGQSSIDGRSDIYSLGCMMFEMASGRPPYVGAGTGDVLAAHIYEPVPPLDPAELSPPLGQLVARMMAKKAEERPASMRAVLAELEASQAAATSSGQAGGTLAGLGPRPPSLQGMQPLPLIPSPPSRKDLAPVRGQPSLGDGARASTTLSRSVGELSIAPPSSPPRLPKLVLVGVIVAGMAIGVGAVALVRGGRGHSQSPAATVPVAIATTPPPPPVKPARVKLRIEANQPGAEVYRGDGTRLGPAPAVDDVARAPGSSSYVVKLRGYGDARVSLPSDSDGTVTANLQRKKKREDEQRRTGDAIVDPFAPSPR
jgi:serine/threonine-protein kinase